MLSTTVQFLRYCCFLRAGFWLKCISDVICLAERPFLGTPVSSVRKKSFRYPVTGGGRFLWNVVSYVPDTVQLAWICCSVPHKATQKSATVAVPIAHKTTHWYQHLCFVSTYGISINEFLSTDISCHMFRKAVAYSDVPSQRPARYNFLRQKWH